MARRLPQSVSSSPHSTRSLAFHDYPWGALAPGEGCALVLGRWTESNALTEQTLARMGETVTRYTRRLHAQGVTRLADVTPADAAGFVSSALPSGAAPELATRHARRTAVRMFYRSLRGLGFPAGDPTLDLALPPRGVLAARPLTDDEVVLGRVSCQVGRGRGGRRHAVAWALGEATAVSSEITAVTVADLDDPDAPRRVRLPGTRRHAPRVGVLTDWGSVVLARRVAELREVGGDGATLLAYGGAAPPGGAKAQASVCNALREVLYAAGLAAETDVRPTSLRHWAGRVAYDRGAPIEEVARLLGHRSLDAAAEDIALDWRLRGAVVAATPGTIR